MSKDNGTSHSSKVNPDDYRKLAILTRSTADHFAFDRKFVKVLGLPKTTALFLQDIINKASLANTVRRLDGFFLCTIEWLENSLDWSPATQTRLFSSLRDMGYVEIERRGAVGNRWVRIDVYRIDNEIYKGVLQGKLPDSDEDLFTHFEQTRSLTLSKRVCSKRANNSKGKTKKGKKEEREEPPTHTFNGTQSNDSIEQKIVKAIATKEVEESRYADEFEERAFKFYRRLQKQNWACHSYNKTTWRKALIDVSKLPDGEYWKRILRVYERFGDKAGRERWGLPQICSTLQFRDRYDWLCEKILYRLEDIEDTLSEEEV